MSLILLKITAFPGDCQIPGYENCIMCNSFKLDMDDTAGGSDDQDEDEDQQEQPSSVKNGEKTKIKKKRRKKSHPESGYRLNFGVERRPGDFDPSPVVGINDIDITKSLDRSSPLLFKAVFYPPTDEQTATIYVFLPGDGATTSTNTSPVFLNTNLVLTLTLSKVNIKSYRLDSEEGDPLSDETITLSFSKLSMTYTSPDPSQGTVTVTVDVATSTAPSQ